MGISALALGGGFPLIGCGEAGPAVTDGGSLLNTGTNAVLPADPDFFRFALLADTHIIDEYYDGDEQDIYLTEERLIQARATINAIDPAVDMAFIAGDITHNYPSADPSFYEQNRTRIDILADVLKEFRMPVYPGFGNHDYDVPAVSREFTHELFKDRLDLDTYYSVDHLGWKFVMLNNFLGETWNPNSPEFNTAFGSLGEEQLNWLEGELQQGMPTFLFMHYMLPLVTPREVSDLGLSRLVRDYKDTIRLFIVGHTHRWINLGDIYGPQHIVAASTRYDPDSFMIFEVSKSTETFRILNYDRFRWGTEFTEPYEEG